MRLFSTFFKPMCFVMFTFLASSVAYAQDSLSNQDIDFVLTDYNASPFYAQLWFWIVIGMVFLLILIALIRGGGSKKDNDELEIKN